MQQNAKLCLFSLHGQLCTLLFILYQSKSFHLQKWGVLLLSQTHVQSVTQFFRFKLFFMLIYPTVALIVNHPDSGKKFVTSLLVSSFVLYNPSSNLLPEWGY